MIDISYNNIIGNNNLKKKMVSLSNNESFNHSYILEGAIGSGKSILARFFAKAILCESDEKPCDTCFSCISFNSNNNPDFHILKSDKKSFGVDLIRDNITEIVNIKPFRSKYKVLILESADKMTVQAQNALLKTIEEPPKYMVFILIAENNKYFLPTIISRCSIMTTMPLDDNTIKQEALKFCDKNDMDIQEDYINFAVNASEGSLGRCLYFLQDEDFKILRQKTLDFFQNINNYNIVDVIKKADSFAKEKVNPEKLYDILIFWYRDLVIYKTTNSTKDCYNIDRKNFIQIKSDLYTLEKLYKKISAISYFKEGYSSNANLTINLEVLFLKLREK